MTEPGGWTDEVQRMIDSALEKERESHAAELAERDARIDALQKVNAGLITTLIPEHAGGPGNEIAETWSQYEQELARAEANAPK